jgi:hypothetical protein
MTRPNDIMEDIKLAAENVERYKKLRKFEPIDQKVLSDVSKSDRPGKTRFTKLTEKVQAGIEWILIALAIIGVIWFLNELNIINNSSDYYDMSDYIQERAVDDFRISI